MVTDTPGVIEPSRLYTVREAQERLRMGDAPWRRFVDEAGIEIIRRGRNRYVLADDLIDALRRQRDGLEGTANEI